MAAVVAVCGIATRAAAAPRNCPQPLQDRYGAGERVTVVGYTDGCLPRSATSSASQYPAVSGYLHADPCADADVPHCAIAFIAQQSLLEPSNGIPLGELVLEESTHELRGLRMSLTFTLPADLAPGVYYVVVCQVTCANSWSYGWPSPLYVGVDPPSGQRPVRHWPLDDPAIDRLPDDALLLGHEGDEVTAAAVREAAAAADDEDASGRTKTAASVADEPESPGSDLRGALWLVAAGLLVLVGWAATRLAPSRKNIRQRP